MLIFYCTRSSDMIYCFLYCVVPRAHFRCGTRCPGRIWEPKSGRGATNEKKGFDNDKYLQMQSQHIRERIAQFDNKLYLEFGGKLFDDYHASRVLPGFQPDSKLQMLLQLKDQAEVVIVINAEDIVSSKVRGDYGITYDLDVLRLIDAFQGARPVRGQRLRDHVHRCPRGRSF